MRNRRRSERIGRNDSCPCGSGKKYKRCCLGKPAEGAQPTTQIHMPYHHAVFSLYFKELGDTVEEKRTAATKEVLTRFFSSFSIPARFPVEESTEVLQRLLVQLEEAIANLVGQHHLYYWLHLYRRLAPADSFGYQSITTVALYREITETSFLKYGKGEIGDDLIMGEGLDPKDIMSGEYIRAWRELYNVEPSAGQFNGVYIGKFGVEQFLQLLSLECLTAEYWYVTACLRRAYKGGALLVDGFDEYRLENDDDTESLIRSYDDRNEEIPTTVATSGIPLHTTLKEFKPGLCLLPQYNYERKKLGDLPCQVFWGIEQTPEWDSLEPNFLWVPFDVETFYIRHEFLSEPFQERNGVSLESFVGCILALCSQLHVDNLESDTGVYQLLQRAYWTWSSLDTLIDRLVDLAEHVLPDSLKAHVPTRPEYEVFFKLLSWDPEDRSDYSLHTRGPRKLTMPTWPGTFIMDYAAIPGILFSLMYRLDADWTEKGLLFEDYVKRSLSDDNFKLWECQRQLVADDGTSKELDISFVLGPVLFVCELKCIGRSFAYERGETEALEYRRAKLEEAIHESEDKVDWLVQNSKGRNYALPGEVTRIVPLVVSPFVEYIWSRSAEYWVTQNIPRVCTPEELLKLKHSKIDQLAKAPYTRVL